MAIWKTTTDLLTACNEFRFIKKDTELKEEDLETLKDAGGEVDHWKAEKIIKPERHSEKKGDGVTFNDDGTYIIEGITKKEPDNGLFLPPAVEAAPPRKVSTKSDEPVETVVPISDKAK